VRPDPDRIVFWEGSPNRTGACRGRRLDTEGGWPGRVMNLFKLLENILGEGVEAELLVVVEPRVVDVKLWGYR